MTATLEGADAAPAAGEQTPGDDIGGVRSNATRALAAIGSQGIVAGSSLVLQWLALWKLGAAGLGTFAILSGGLQVTATALHTGWVGDPLALVDRHHPPIRRALPARRPCRVRPAPASADVRESRSLMPTSAPWPTADRRCRRLCGLSRSGWP